MLKRTITGLCILIVLAGFIALKLVSSLFFDAFVLIMIYACLIEMFLAYKVADKTFFIVPLVLLPIGLWAIFKFTTMPLVFILIALLCVFIISMISELVISAKKRKQDTDEDIESKPQLLSLTKSTMFVAVYPTLLLAFLFGINNFELSTSFVGLIMVFAISIFTDVFAYCFGMMLGQKSPHKLAPEISPKKSVVGSVFGLIGGIIAGALGWLLFYHLNLIDGALASINLAESIVLFSVLGVFGSVLTQLGDLVASAFKRMVGLKDFGNIFPGHGGFMDRVDGQMFSATLVYLLFMVIV